MTTKSNEKGATTLFLRNFSTYVNVKNARVIVDLYSGAGTNLKVGGAPVRSESGGGNDPAPRRREKISGRVPSLFGSKSTISRFDERFRDDQYSLVAFSFVVLLLTVPPPCPAICKSGGHVPPCPMESTPLGLYQV